MIIPYKGVNIRFITLYNGRITEPLSAYCPRAFLIFDTTSRRSSTYLKDVMGNNTCTIICFLKVSSYLIQLTLALTRYFMVTSVIYCIDDYWDYGHLCHLLYSKLTTGCKTWTTADSSEPHSRYFAPFPLCGNLGTSCSTPPFPARTASWDKVLGFERGPWWNYCDLRKAKVCISRLLW